MEMSNVLKGKRTYISGPIEYGSSGHNWRTAPTSILKDRFELEVFDPFADPKQQWVPQIQKARDAKDYDQIAKIAKCFVRKDLSLVDRSDFVIAYLPYKVPTTGTHHEIINSNNAKKPTLLVIDDRDISFLPIWYFGFIPKTCMFPNWEAVYVYLEEVQQGKHRDNNRWSFIYGDI